jgi:hypothetical protein
VQDNCKSYRAFDHDGGFGMGEENAPIYLRTRAYKATRAIARGGS